MVPNESSVQTEFYMSWVSLLYPEMLGILFSKEPGKANINVYTIFAKIYVLSSSNIFFFFPIFIVRGVTIVNVFCSISWNQVIIRGYINILFEICGFFFLFNQLKEIKV